MNNVCFKDGTIETIGSYRDIEDIIREKLGSDFLQEMNSHIIPGHELNQLYVVYDFMIEIGRLYNSVDTSKDEVPIDVLDAIMDKVSHSLNILSEVL